jgi:hypothetical protein
MKVKRRKFNIFEQLELAPADTKASGPVEEYILTQEEFMEFQQDAKNRPGVSFRAVKGRPGDAIGGDWYFRGAIITVASTTKKRNVKSGT